MNADSAELDQTLREQGYFLKNFVKRMTEEELGFDEDSIGDTEFELEKIMTPRNTYNDIHHNVSYEELTQGFDNER